MPTISKTSLSFTLTVLRSCDVQVACMRSSLDRHEPLECLLDHIATMKRNLDLLEGTIKVEIADRNEATQKLMEQYPLWSGVTGGSWFKRLFTHKKKA